MAIVIFLHSSNYRIVLLLSLLGLAVMSIAIVRLRWKAIKPEVAILGNNLANDLHSTLKGGISPKLETMQIKPTFDKVWSRKIFGQWWIDRIVLNIARSSIDQIITEDEVVRNVRAFVVKWLESHRAVLVKINVIN